jgi:hypothetical protein
MIAGERRGGEKPTSLALSGRPLIVCQRPCWILPARLSAADVEDIAVLNKNERTGPDPDKFDGR